MMDQDGKSTNKSIIKEAKKNTPSKASRTEQAINKSPSSATKIVSKVQIVDQILSKIQELERREAEINQFLAMTSSTTTTAAKVDQLDKFVEKVIKMPSSSIPIINSYRPHGIQSTHSMDWHSSSSYHAPYSEQVNIPIRNMGNSSKVTFNNNDNYSWKTSNTHMSHRRGAETKYDIGSRRNEMNDEQLIGNVTDHWKTPKILTTNETAFVSHYNNGIDNTGLGNRKDISITESGPLIPQQLYYQPGLPQEKNEIEDLTAIRRQKEALQKLPRLTATLELRQSVKEYKKEFRRERELREIAFRSRGVTLAETVILIADALVDDLVNEAAEEIDRFVDRYAEKILDDI